MNVLTLPLLDYLRELGACHDAIVWSRNYPDLQTAWGSCERGDWMLWYVARVRRRPGSKSTSPRYLFRAMIRISRETERAVAALLIRRDEEPAYFATYAVTWAARAEVSDSVDEAMDAAVWGVGAARRAMTPENATVFLAQIAGRVRAVFPVVPVRHD